MRHIWYAARCAALAAALVAPALTAPAAAQRAPARPTGAFVVLLGQDTLSLERFTRSGNTVTGDVIVRTPRFVWLTYTATLAPDGSATRVDYTQRLTGDASAPPAATVSTVYRADSVVTTITRGQQPAMTRTTAGGSFGPWVSNAVPVYAMFELAVQRVLAAGRDTVLVLPPGAQSPLVFGAHRVGQDSLVIDEPYEGPAADRARVDKDGRLLGLSAPNSTFKVSVQRVPDLDIAAHARAWSAAPSMGQLSPADSVTARAGGATVFVRYGRPAKRGRVIFGPAPAAVVPWDSVWRTGANEATLLRTDRDLVLNGTTLPAGSYTLFSIPTRTGWTLIVNKQTTNDRGAPLWGTDYSATQDFARVPAQVARLATPVERFTIAVDPAATGGTLRLQWDTTEVRVPFTVKPQP